MQSNKIIKFEVYKPEDYQPIPNIEKQRITNLLAKAILEVANRFDGISTFEIIIKAKGNA